MMSGHEVRYPAGHGPVGWANEPAPASAVVNTIPAPDRWGGWQRWVFPGVWLAFLAQTLDGVHRHSSGAAAVVGYLIVFVFAYGYLWALPMYRDVRRARIGLIIGALSALTVIEAFLAHEDAFVMAVYIGVLFVARYGIRGLVGVGVLTVLAVLVPPLIGAWHTGIDWGMALTLPMVGFAMFGFFSIIRANQALTSARAEIARLAAENERSRIARDLHDLLGHSLTTITVKAALAHRLAQRDPVRAAIEIGEVEALTRGTLADVRAAVTGYRDVSLAGELATAAQVLRAAGIAVTMPGAVDDVPAAHSELFGWVVREGVTNVVRHSRATSCVITVGPDWLEISDDGRGSPAAAGTGLIGVRERVDAVGGTVTAGRPAASPDPIGRDGTGWTLRVDVREAADAPDATPTVTTPTLTTPTVTTPADGIAAHAEPAPSRLAP